MLKSKNISNSRFGFSEEYMANAFQDLLQSHNGLPKIGVFDGIFREISCLQGRPDFIAIRNPSGQETLSFANITGYVGPLILSILQPIAPRTLDFIVSHSGYSRVTVRKFLKRLLESEHVEQTETGAYRLGKTSAEINIEMWSFELKLANARRAVFQAQQSRAFAERAIIVIPPGQERNYKKYYMAMKRWGIGLATFNPITKAFFLVRKGRKSKAFSRTHQLYALSQIGMHKNADEKIDYK